MRVLNEILHLPDSAVEGKKMTGDARAAIYLLDSLDIESDRMRPAVIICPGGGYEHLSQREGEPVAMQYLSMGYQAIVLHYSLAPDCFPTALLELALLVAKVRQHAEEWKIDREKIIVSGFSAGGHLACSLGAFWNQEFVYGAIGVTAEDIRPNGMILGYPVITSGPYCHKGSFLNLLGREVDDEEKRRLVSLEYQVGPHTPQTFLWHTVTDQSVPVQNSLLLAEALVEHHVNLEFHVYPVGRHGLALASEETAGGQAYYVEPQCQSWISLVKCWMEHI